MKYPFFRPGSYTFFTREAITQGGMDFPKMLNVEPTNQCNFHCVMCSRHRSRRPIGRMPMSLFCSIIEDVLRCGKKIKWLTLHNAGEPLLHPELSEMIRYAKSSGAVEYVHFNTNGQLLDPDTATALAEAGLDDLTVSIDAFSPETFQKVKGAGDLTTVVKNTLQLMKIKRDLGRSNPWVRAKMIEMPLTRKELATFRQYWRSRADEVQIQPIHNGAGALELDPSPQHANRYPCSLLWYSLSVNWDGTVSPCCADLSGRNIIGDLRSDSLKYVFSEGRIRVYRDKMLNGLEQELSPCFSCGAWKNGVNLFYNGNPLRRMDHHA
jgi:MoaA/NifB/PqqE/SkfB family radical SAM enzyme